MNLPFTTPRSGRKPRGGSAVDLPPADAGLLERLKQWRLGQARAQALPAYVILHDSTLADLARRRPRTLDELAGVPGIGMGK